MADPFGFVAPEIDPLTGNPVNADFGALSRFGGMLGSAMRGLVPSQYGDALAGRTQAAPEIPGQITEGDVFRSDMQARQNALGAAQQAVGMIGAGGSIPVRSNATLGIVPVDVAKRMRQSSDALPSGEAFERAVANTPNARIEDGSLVMPVYRRQHPDQEMAESVRGGVFYLPSGAKNQYTGRYGYGGSQRIEGETAFNNPLLVKGGTGGKAPEAAFDQLNGKGAYQRMRTEAINSLGGFGASSAQKGEQVYSFLEKHAPEMADLSDYVIMNSGQGNQLPYALQEAAVASALRRAGHDAVLGYSKARRADPKPKISEVFDVRENRYPSPSGDYSVWPQFGALAGR